MTFAAPFVCYVISAMRARDPHISLIVMTQASPTGSRLARQLLHIGHYAAPPKRRNIDVFLLVSLSSFLSLVLFPFTGQTSIII